MHEFNLWVYGFSEGRSYSWKDSERIENFTYEVHKGSKENVAETGIMFLKMRDN